MKKVFFLLFPFFFIFISCQKNEDKIEIYLTKERIESTDGILIKDFYTEEKLQNLPNFSIERIKKLITKNARIDTTKEYRNIIYCGKFIANFEEWEKSPIINNSEIISFNVKESTFEFDKLVIEKLSKIEFDENYIGKQFAICVNKKPIMFGYFLNSFQSYYSENYTLHLAKDKRLLPLNKNGNLTSLLLYGNNFKPLDTIKEKEFIAALKKTNRLVHE
jgi:hypothetical protein